MANLRNRRNILASLASAAAATMVGARGSLAAEAPPETTTIRLAKIPSICVAPQYVVDELLRAEGFGDIRYVAMSAAVQHRAITRGEVDFSLHFVGPSVIAIDAGDPLTVLVGAHVGCFELFAREGIRGITDLKGKSVSVQSLGSSQHVFLSSMAAYVGVDPAKDIDWVVSTAPKPLDLFADGKVDAFLAFPPEPQELRARNIGHVVVSSAVDRPWSRYFCCMLVGNTDYIRAHPVATKRVLRAILKAADLCASEPERVARRLVDDGFAPRFDYALKTLNEIPYDKWQEYDPEDTIRFYALRLHEAAMIKSPPNKIIAEGTDWRFLNELKRELKA